MRSAGSWDTSDGKRIPYMFSHEFPASNPLSDIEVSVSKPGVSISASATPKSSRHVIIKMHINTLCSEFFCCSIEDLQASGAFIELRVMLQDFLKNDTAVCSPKGVDESILKRDISPIVQDIIYHLDSECQTDDIEVEASNLGNDVFDGGVLETFWDHSFLVSCPIGADKLHFFVVG